MKDQSGPAFRDALIECINDALWVNSTSIELGENRATGVMCSNFKKADKDIANRIEALLAELGRE